ncbi:hypothetical protein NKH77_48240 [Streptomyces sp. M19]
MDGLLAAYRTGGAPARADDPPGTHDVSRAHDLSRTARDEEGR